MKIELVINNIGSHMNIFLLSLSCISGLTATEFPPTVTELQPSFGPSAGGTMSTIVGFDFVEGTTICRYGESSSPSTQATFISSTGILCISPLLSSIVSPVLNSVQMVGFAVSNDGGGQFDTSGVRFMYLAPRKNQCSIEFSF